LSNANVTSDIQRSFKTTYFVTTVRTNASLTSGAQCRPLATYAKS